MLIIQLTDTLYEKELKILRYPTKLGQKDIKKCRNQRHLLHHWYKIQDKYGIWSWLAISGHNSD